MAGSVILPPHVNREIVFSLLLGGQAFMFNAAFERVQTLVCKTDPFRKKL